MGYAGTKAMGLAAVEYFERGGNIAGLAGVVSTATAKATQIAGDVAPLLRGSRALDREDGGSPRRRVGSQED